MRLVIFMFSVALYLSSNAHPTHISISNIRINDTLIEINISITKHDIVNLLSANQEKHSEDFIEDERTENILKEYIAQNFKLSINAIAIKLGNFKIENDESNFTISFSNILKSNCNTITILNKLLLDLSPEQKNLLIISNNNFEKGIEFNNNKQTETIKF